MKKVFVSSLTALLVAAGAHAETTFVFKLDGSQENPPTGSAATGTGHATYDENTNTLSVVVTHNVQNAVASHIHRAPRGSNGSVVFPFDDPQSPITGSFTLTDDQVAELMAGNYYVNVHSTQFGGGEIRGQLIRGLTSFSFKLSGSQEVPPNNSEATGSGIGYISAEEDTFVARTEHNVQNAVASHIHEAPAGSNGSVVFPFDSPQSPITGTWENLSAHNLDTLHNAGNYINVHSTQFGGGEIRAQIVQGGECGEREKTKGKCRRGKVKGKLARGVAGENVLFCLDGGDCAMKTVNENGKASMKWKNVADGDHLVTVHRACGNVDSHVASCAP